METTMVLKMRWKYSLLYLLLFYATSFLDAKETITQSTEQNGTYENLNTEKSGEKCIIGKIERVRLVPPNVVLKARIDTGAKTTSIDAREITPFERDGKQWVRFVIMDGDKPYLIEKSKEDCSDQTSWNRVSRSLRDKDAYYSGRNFSTD